MEFQRKFPMQWVQRLSPEADDVQIVGQGVVYKKQNKCRTYNLVVLFFSANVT